LPATLHTAHLSRMLGVKTRGYRSVSLRARFYHQAWAALKPARAWSPHPRRTDSEHAQAARALGSEPDLG